MNHLLKDLNWNPPNDWLKIKTIDMHTGGEPLRILIEGLPEIKGDTILEKRNYFKMHYDHIRRGLMFEPRGHADMYGAIITDPTSPEADFDAFFIHNEGYSTMCGHAILALTKFAFESQLFSSTETNKLNINVPAGIIEAEAHIDQGIVIKSSFINVPSYLYLENKEVLVPGLGNIKFDIAYGGAFYAIVNATALNLSLDVSDYNRLIDYGRRIKSAVMDHFEIIHPVEQDLGFLYGTIFTGPAIDKSHHSRNVCIFAEGEVDRSATGSGVSARAGLHYAKGALGINEVITIESIIGSTMSVEVLEDIDYHGHRAVIPKVSGSASFVGESTFCFDPKDPYRDGFILR